MGVLTMKRQRGTVLFSQTTPPGQKQATEIPEGSRMACQLSGHYLFGQETDF